MGRGGGFGGGGFGGGGFRGGGFRGGSSSFRSGSVRSSGRPFGRTGAHRSVSRSPGGRNYHRPHHRRHYGGWGYRPWYRRYYWFWGWPYRPWYYSPVYIGGGFMLFILALLIIIPLIGLFTIPYPTSDASSDGVVTYRDTQTLYFNEYWFEREELKVGSTINYQQVESSSGPITFLLWNEPFENFPTTGGSRTGNYSETMTVQADHDYQYLGYFMRPGDQMSFDFSVISGNSIEFFIADANDLSRWNNWENINPVDSYIGSAGYDGSFTAPYAQDWYMVWYNSGSSPITLDIDVAYTVAALDFSQADVVEQDVESVSSGSYTVPESGNWYFFIYFDPFVNPADTVDITFDISFDTQVTSNDRWQDTTPILIFIGLVIVIILAVALYQRKNAKVAEAKEKEKKASPDASTTTLASGTTPQSQTMETTFQTSSSGTCPRCSYKYLAGDIYCKNCGGKLIGRDYGLSKVSTPAGSSNCINCKEKLDKDAIFCRNCGVKVGK
ncbi:MAG: double zinc ribbon domain-containing protein [Candidatus Hodarchaeales archaeon]